MNKILLLLIVFAFTAIESLMAEVKPNPLFSDGAVLQCDMGVLVLGTAKDGEKVAVLGFSTNINSSTVIQRYGADYVAVEAENTRDKKINPGLVVARTNSVAPAVGNNVLPSGLSYISSQGSSIIADPRFAAACGHRSMVSYQLVFSKPGTYYLYFRESLFYDGIIPTNTSGTYGGNDLVYYATNFGLAATANVGSKIKQDGSDVDNPLTNSFRGRYFWYKAATIYTVSSNDVGKTLTFNVDDRVRGMSLNRLIFSQNANLKVTGLKGLDSLPNSPYDETSATYPMSNVPQEETDAEINARELYLQGMFKQNFIALSNQITGGHAFTVITNLIALSNTESDDRPNLNTLVALGTYFPATIPMIISNVEAAGYRAMKVATNAILTIGGWDLNVTTHVQIALNDAWVLKVLGSYFGNSPDQVKYRAAVERFINAYIEGKPEFFMTGKPYYTMGYNKTINVMDIGASVTCLYMNMTNYPLTKATFETAWTNVTATSYDADNSPHYDSSTGFYEILQIGLRLGRQKDLINSSHLKRIMDRMSRTVMNSGQSAKWGKSMEVYNKSKGMNYLQIRGGDIQWTLKVGYLLWANPFYLYVARKYEAFYLLNPQPIPYQIDLWPIGIEQFNVTLARPNVSDSPCRATPRITNRIGKKYNGYELMPNDTNYMTVPDKLVLSTGHHPRAPYMLMDLSFTQSKACGDHRSGITTANYNGAHTVTVKGRWGECNKMNEVFICPANFLYPNVPVTANDVWPSHSWYGKMGYTNTYAWSGYTNTVWDAGMISSNVAYGTTTFARYEYQGVGEKRQVVLLNNGITVVADTITTSTNYAGRHNGGTLWQVFPKANAMLGSNWVLLQNLPKQLPFELTNGEAVDSPTLIYFASVPNNTTIATVNNPYDPENKTRNWFCAYRPLTPAQSFTIISVVMPIANLNNYSNLLAGIGTIVTPTNQTVFIPYGRRAFNQVCFANGKNPDCKFVNLDPVIFAVPTNLVVSAASNNGALVNFTTTASNNANGLLPTTNVPGSGSLFPVGTTTVTVTATDAIGDAYSTTFNVNVVSATTPVAVHAKVESVTPN